MTAVPKTPVAPTPYPAPPRATPHPAAPAALVSVADYLAAEAASAHKHEYVGGRVYAMAGGRNVHNAIATAFLGMMYGRLRGKPCQPFNSDTKLRVRLATQTRFYYPDAMVVCEPNAPGEAFQDRPRLVAEIVSASTRRTDEGEKRDAYLTVGSLAAYLLIETDVPRVTVYRRTDSGFVPEQYDGTEAVVPLDDLGTTLPLAELYDRVDFAAAAAENAADAE